MSMSWWSVNLTERKGEYKNDILEADQWTSYNVSSHFPIGSLHDKKSVQINFASKRSCENVGPCIQRYVHKSGWPHAPQFQEVREVKTCGRNGTIPLTGAKTNCYCAANLTSHVAGMNANLPWCVYNQTLRLVEAAWSLLDDQVTPHLKEFT